MSDTTVKTDGEIIIELCEIIFALEAQKEKLEDEIKMLKLENSTLKSEQQ